MEYKIGDEVIVKCLGSVWTIRFIRVVPDTGRTYFVSQDNETMWVDEYEIKPAIPRESRWALKTRIKELEEQLQAAENMPLPVKDRQIEELQKQVEEMEQYKHHVGILRSRLSITENQRSKLEEKISKLEKQLLAYDISVLPADAQEAVRIVEALEKMPCYWKLCKNGYGEWLFHDNTDSDHPDRLTGRPRHTISQALQAAGLMEEKEE